MKTQIILRIIFIIIAMFIFTTNDGNYINAHTEFAVTQSLNHNTSETGSKTDNKSVPHNNNNSNKGNPYPYIPDSHLDNDFDCFDFKHHEKRIFWRCIANKAFAFLYHLTVLLALMGQLLIH